jgi:hypothetical protein
MASTFYYIVQVDTDEEPIEGEPEAVEENGRRFPSSAAFADFVGDAFVNDVERLMEAETWAVKAKPAHIGDVVTVL